MKVAVFSSKSYDREFLSQANTLHNHELMFLPHQLDYKTAQLADGFEAICLFVNDRADRKILEIFCAGGTKLIALRSSGFNNVDIAASHNLGITVARVPAYSPHAIAEHTLALLLALTRKVHRAHARIREGNFSLEGLLGYDIHGKTVGIVGTGRIGLCVMEILRGFGCKLICSDPKPGQEAIALGADYLELPELFKQADIISLHCPLVPETRYLINEATLKTMKDGICIINTSRGALIDTAAAIQSLKSGKIALLGLDVYEEEEALFFTDLSNTVIQDDVFSRLMTFPNVLITGHQAFFSKTALESIANATLNNISEFEKTGLCTNAIQLHQLKRT